MPVWKHDGLEFHYLQTAAAGVPFFFQHGLGGNVDQPFGLFKPGPSIRLLAFDCRAHGQTRPVGDESKISLATFADDLASLMDGLQIPRAIVGGTSMGAATALNFALRFPARVLGLVLSRPAWLAGPMRENARVFGEIAQYLRQQGPQRGLELFEQTETFRQARLESSDTAESLRQQFLQPRAQECVARLERIPRDSPCASLEELKSLQMPVLICANRQDPIHPFAYGTILAEQIPAATFVELTPKSVSLAQHTADVQAALAGFIDQHLPAWQVACAQGK